MYIKCTLGVKTMLTFGIPTKKLQLIKEINCNCNFFVYLPSFLIYIYNVLLHNWITNQNYKDADKCDQNHTQISDWPNEIWV